MARELAAVADQQRRQAGEPVAHQLTSGSGMASAKPARKTGCANPSGATSGSGAAGRFGGAPGRSPSATMLSCFLSSPGRGRAVDAAAAREETCSCRASSRWCLRAAGVKRDSSQWAEASGTGGLAVRGPVQPARRRRRGFPGRLFGASTVAPAPGLRFRADGSGFARTAARRAESCRAARLRRTPALRDLPQPRERSPPKPESASSRKAACTGPFQRACCRVIGKRNHRPQTGARDEIRCTPWNAAPPRRSAGPPRRSSARRCETGRAARRAPGTRSGHRRSSDLHRAPARRAAPARCQRHEARALPAHLGELTGAPASGGQMVRGGTTKPISSMKRETRAEADRRRRAGCAPWHPASPPVAQRAPSRTSPPSTANRCDRSASTRLRAPESGPDAPGAGGPQFDDQSGIHWLRISLRAGMRSRYR